MIQRNQSQKSFADWDIRQTEKAEKDDTVISISFSAIVFLAIYKIIHSTLVLVPAFLII